MTGATAISTDNYYRAYVVGHIAVLGHIAELNNYLEYNLDDKHTVNLSLPLY